MGEAVSLCVWEEASTFWREGACEVTSMDALAWLGFRPPQQSRSFGVLSVDLLPGLGFTLTLGGSPMAEGVCLVWGVPCPLSLTHIGKHVTLLGAQSRVWLIGALCHKLVPRTRGRIMHIGFLLTVFASALALGGTFTFSPLPSFPGEWVGRGDWVCPAASPACSTNAGEGSDCSWAPALSHATLFNPSLAALHLASLPWAGLIPVLWRGVEGFLTLAMG